MVYVDNPRRVFAGWPGIHLLREQSKSTTAVSQTYGNTAVARAAFAVVVDGWPPAT